MELFDAIALGITVIVAAYIIVRRRRAAKARHEAFKNSFKLTGDD